MIRSRQLGLGGKTHETAMGAKTMFSPGTTAEQYVETLLLLLLLLLLLIITHLAALPLRYHTAAKKIVPFSASGKRVGDPKGRKPVHPDQRGGGYLLPANEAEPMSAHRAREVAAQPMFQLY
jgi:hypothetical protein